jgi:hypothetical protein
MKLYSGKPEKAKAKHVFKNNDYYAGVYVRRETPSLQRSIGHQWKPVKLKKSQRLPHSAAKRRTFKKISAVSIRRKPRNALFHAEAFGDLEPEHFNKAMKGLIKRLRSTSAEYIYMLEWAEYEDAAHSPCRQYPRSDARRGGGICRGLYVIGWGNAEEPNTRIKQDARPVYDAPKLFGYMSKIRRTSSTPEQ